MTWQDIQGDMFDFKNYYHNVAVVLKSGCKIVECGVANGKSAIFLAEKLNEMGKDFHLYMVDNLAYGGNKQLQEIVRNISLSGLGQKITLLPMSSLDASTEFNGHSVDFVFLDSSHEYSQTKAEAFLWWHKVKNGGILAGHDYFLYEGVRNAINELTSELTVINTEKDYGVYEIVKDDNKPLKFL